MSWIDFLWPMVTGACVTMGVIHFRLGLRHSAGSAHLLFALNAFVVAAYSYFEHALTRAESPVSYLALLRWLDVAAAALVVTIAAFVWAFFGTGRKWLAILAASLSCTAVTLDFLPEPRLVFLELTGIRRLETFGGAPFTVADGVRNPWNAVFYLGVLALLVFVADASISLWRRGARRRAWVIGGTVTFFVIAGGLLASLVDAGVLQAPYLLSFAYLAIVIAMGLELNNDVFRAEQLAHDLGESEQRMRLAVEAANFGVWIRDLERGEIWASEQWRSLFGFGKEVRLEVDGILHRIHPEDREPLRRTLTIAVEHGGDYETEYRIVLPDGRMRWISSRLRAETNGGGHPAIVRGVSIDITARKLAEMELHERRGELAHLSRVTMLGELSGSLAHELNQPLTAILSNAQAAEHYLAEDAPDLGQVREILADIVAEDERAGEVIRRLRLLLKKGEVQQQVLDPNQVVLEALKLARSDLTSHGVTVETALAVDLAPIYGDCVQLQQVLLNFVMNACDAMADNVAKDPRLIVRTCQEDGRLRIEVSDNGRGLPAGGAEQAFERYFTTKPHGLGLGLSICRSIITAHGGTLGAANNAERGATFHCTLPLRKEPHG